MHLEIGVWFMILLKCDQPKVWPECDSMKAKIDIQRSTIANIYKPDLSPDVQIRTKSMSLLTW